MFRFGFRLSLAGSRLLCGPTATSSSSNNKVLLLNKLNAAANANTAALVMGPYYFSSLSSSVKGGSKGGHSLHYYSTATTTTEETDKEEQMEDLAEGAEDGFEQMQEEKPLSSDPITASYAARISRYTRRGLFGQARELFNELKSLQQVPGAIAYNAMIYSSIIAKDVAGARAYFDEALKNDNFTEVTFSTMLRGYARFRSPTQAQEVFDKLISHGYKPTMDNFNNLILAYGLAGFTDEALKVFVEMNTKYGIAPDVRVINSLLRTLLLVDDIASCIALFRDTPVNAAQQTIPRYLGKQGPVSATNGIFFPMISPDVEVDKGAIREDMFSILQLMNKSGIKPSYITYAILMQYAMGKRAFRTASQLFHNMRQNDVTPDRFSYNLFLKICSFGRYLEDALQAFEEMQSGPFGPDRITYNEMLRCATFCQRFDVAVDILRQMKAVRVRPTPSSYNLLIQAAAKDQQVDYAFDLFHQCINNDIPVSVSTILEMVKGTTEAGNLVRLPEILNYLKLANNPIDDRGAFSIANSVLDAFAKKGDIEQMEKIFAEWWGHMTAPLAAYNIMMKGYLKAGDQEKAKEIFDSLPSKGLEPDGFTYAPFIAEMDRKDDLEGMRDLIAKVKELKRVRHPGIFNPYFSILARHHQFDEALQFLRDYPDHIGRENTAIFRPLFLAVQERGDIEKAKEIYEFYQERRMNNNFNFVRSMRVWLSQHDNPYLQQQNTAGQDPPPQ